jgi:hypothetical protein
LGQRSEAAANLQTALKEKPNLEFIPTSKISNQIAVSLSAAIRLSCSR